MPEPPGTGQGETAGGISTAQTSGCEGAWKGGPRGPEVAGHYSHQGPGGGKAHPQSAPTLTGAEP